MEEIGKCRQMSLTSNLTVLPFTPDVFEIEEFNSKTC